jgi:hypothetical protein
MLLVLSALSALSLVSLPVFMQALTCIVAPTAGCHGLVTVASWCRTCVACCKNTFCVTRANVIYIYHRV